MRLPGHEIQELTQIGNLSKLFFFFRPIEEKFSFPHMKPKKKNAKQKFRRKKQQSKKGTRKCQYLFFLFSKKLKNNFY